MKDDDYIEVKEGDELTFDVLEWYHEGYEFGRPCLMLSPVIRENSDSHPEAMIEDACMMASIDGRLLYNRERRQIDWRGWNLKTLRRAFNQALAGKKFPKAGYTATRQKVKFVKNERGELEWINL